MPFVRILDTNFPGVQVKSGPGGLRGFFIANRSAGERIIKFYDSVGAPVLAASGGNPTPFATVSLAAGQRCNLMASAHDDMHTFSLGLWVAATVDWWDWDVVPPAVNDVISNIVIR